MKHPEVTNFDATQLPSTADDSRAVLPCAQAVTVVFPTKRNTSRFSPRRRRASATNTGGVEAHTVIQGALVCQSLEFQNLAA